MKILPVTDELIEKASRITGKVLIANPLKGRRSFCKPVKKGGAWGKQGRSFKPFHYAEEVDTDFDVYRVYLHHDTYLYSLEFGYLGNDAAIVVKPVSGNKNSFRFVAFLKRMLEEKGKGGAMLNRIVTGLPSMVVFNYAEDYAQYIKEVKFEYELQGNIT